MIKLAEMKFYKKVFEPTFDELTLLVLAYTCILLVGASTHDLIKSGQIHQNINGLVALIPATPIVVGIALSLHHAFSKRKKGRFEKQIMFLFASFVSGLPGFGAVPTYCQTAKSGRGFYCSR